MTQILKQFRIDVDITISKTIYLTAANELEAEEQANDMIKSNIFRYTHGETYVAHEITDVAEEE